MMGFPDRTTEIVQDVLSYFAENSKYTLADSKHAPKNARQMLAAKGPSVRVVLSSFCTHMGQLGGVPLRSTIPSRTIMSGHTGDEC
jgi:hypothetical protein